MHMHEKYSVIKVNAYKNKCQTSWIIIRAYLYAFTLFCDYDMVWDAVVLFSPGFAIQYIWKYFDIKKSHNFISIFLDIKNTNFRSRNRRKWYNSASKSDIGIRLNHLHKSSAKSPYCPPFDWYNRMVNCRIQSNNRTDILTVRKCTVKE